MDKKNSKEEVLAKEKHNAKIVFCYGMHKQLLKRVINVARY